MNLAGIDWLSIIAFFVIALVVGVVVAKRAGSSTSEFFLAGRHMPWWMLGISMVATTFSTDTPNLVTDITRQTGVAGNWTWWAFLLTGMLTVFVYAKLWRRSGVMTDIEFYEMRYSGPSAAFLRGFRAIYLGVFFNVLIMASVTLAAIKIGGVLFGMSPFQTITIAATITVIYSVLGGLSGVLITDLLQFAVAMIGAVLAAWYALGHPEVGGLSGLLAHENVQGRLSLLPDFGDPSVYIPVMLVPLAVQWWSVWYPGAEPGGGGYVAQRMLSARNERHALGATLLFNAAHYALRPWPWIIVALCSLVVFPDLESLKAAFPGASENIIRHDMAYPAMLTAVLPRGLLGLVVASLIAAYMSTISTHLNWGSSYVVNDFYKRFLRPDATQKQQVMIGRISTVCLMILAALLALCFENAFQTFGIMLQVGAGTGLLFLLRWFWWRINAWSELTAMVVSFCVALFFALGSDFGMPAWGQMVTGVMFTTFCWVAVTLFTRPADEEHLREFYRTVQPGGPGWRRVLETARREGVELEPPNAGWDVPVGLLCMFYGCVAVYGTLFATGFWIYGRFVGASVLTVLAVTATVLLVKTWGRLRFH